MDPRPAQGPQVSVQRLRGSRQGRAHERGAGGPACARSGPRGLIYNRAPAHVSKSPC